MLFSGLYKIMVNKVTFVGFRGGRSPQSPPLDPPLLRTVYLCILAYEDATMNALKNILLQVQILS